MAIDQVELLLSLAGDVESNPRPRVEELLSEILSNQKQMAGDIYNNLSEIKSLQRNVDSVTQVLSQRLDQIEQKVKTLSSSVGAIGDCQGTVATLTKKITDMESKLVDLEDRGRRNLINHGVAEPEGETSELLCQEVIEGAFFKTLGVRVSTTERLHRIGAKRQGRKRPVIIKLYDYQEKRKVMENCLKLKGSQISISEDFSYHTRQIRKKLWKSKSSIRSEGGRVSLVYNKIRVNNEMYRWDSVKEERVQCTPRAISEQEQR